MSYEEPEELPLRPRRRLLEPVPVALLAVLMIACGFIGGVLVEKGQSSSSPASLGGGIAGRLAAFRNGATGASVGGAARAGGGAGFFGRSGGFSGAAGGGRGATVGQVSYVAKDTLYVANAEGFTVKVKTSAGSSISKTVKTSVDGIHPGDTVIVQGTHNKDGAINATSISVSSGAGTVGGALGALFGSSRTTSGSGGSGAAAPEGPAAGGGPALFGP